VDIQSSEESPAEGDEEADNNEHDGETYEPVDTLPPIRKFDYGDRSASRRTVSDTHVR
jgi:hypothetical protein